MTMMMAIPAMPVMMLSLGGSSNHTHQYKSGEERQQHTLHESFSNRGEEILTPSTPGNW